MSHHRLTPAPTDQDEPMIRRLAALLAAPLLVLAACGDSDEATTGDETTTTDGTATTGDGDAPTTTAGGAPLAVELTAALTTGDGTATIAYTVTNGGDSAIVVHDQLPDPTGRREDDVLGTVDPDRAWVLQRPDGTIEISKRLFDGDVLGGVQSITPVAIGGRIVEPGQSVEGRAIVPLPYETDATLASEQFPVTDPDAGSAVFCVTAGPVPDTATSRPDGIVEAYHNEPGGALTLTCVPLG